MINGDPDLFDICAGRHRSNSQSISANADNASHRDKQREQVFDLIKRANGAGATCDEVAIRLGTTPNAISGRFTELKMKSLIEKHGTRPTRTGSKAGVYVAK